MQAPVSMLAGYAAKSNTALVLSLLVGLAVLTAIKTTPTQQTQRTSR